jgi:uncharacterized membrane protein
MIEAVLFTFTVTVEVALTLLAGIVAVMVAGVLAVTCGAVNSPDAVMTPMLLLQFTEATTDPPAVAEHWLVCRD